MNFKREFLKYLKYWPLFVVSLLLSVGAAYFYLESVAPTYETAALINIDKKNDKQIVTSSTTAVKEEDALEDEKLILTSTEFLGKIVEDLNLNISFYEKNRDEKKVSSDVPFVFKSNIAKDKLPEVVYDVKIVAEGFIVKNTATEKRYLIRSHSSKGPFIGLPFTVMLTEEAKKNLGAFIDKEYVVAIAPTYTAIKNLKNTIGVENFESPKGTLRLSYTGTNPELSVKILTKVIQELGSSMVENKQKNFQKTITYLNERIAVFAKEKDSIQRVKESYLRDNNIFVLDQFIASKTSEKSTTTANSAMSQRQISMVRVAINDIKRSSATSALGTDYNLDAPSINQQLVNYNSSLLESELLLQRAQVNNPAYLSLVSKLKVQKQVILNSLEDYLSYLNQTNRVNTIEKNTAASAAKSIPKKDKELGNINNDLSLKEETYLALLQKKEETLLNGAALEATVRVLDAPETNYGTTFPKRNTFFLGAILFAFVLSFGIVYLIFQMNSKIHSEEDFKGEIANIPFLGSIPKISQKEKLDNSATSRSTIAEATRTLFANISYMVPNSTDEQGKVILFSSSIQGEGKSFCSFHNAITISNLNKKVLLIGADLRNPQLHSYFNTDRNRGGLSDYLADSTVDWKSSLLKESEYSENLHVLFSGEIRPNPSQLLTNSNFQSLIDEAKLLYDYIIIDSTPVQIVSDAFNYSAMADVTVFVLRYDHTDKSSLRRLNDLIKKEQLKNVGIVINGIRKNSGYGYDYSYNYGYQEQFEKKPWYKRVMG